MIYLLDTNGISALMREDPRISAWLAAIQDSDRVVICTITRGEILFGLERLPQGRRRAALEIKALQLFAGLPCEPISSAAGDIYAHIKADQQRRGLPLSENDLWIAATALALSAVLVSRDSDFREIAGLTMITP